MGCAIGVAALVAGLSLGDPYFTSTPHGFVTANCETGGVTDIYVVNSDWLCVVNDYMTNYWNDIVAADRDAFGGGITNRYALSYSNYLAGLTRDYEHRRDMEEMYDWWAPVVRPAYDIPLNTASFFTVTSPDDPAYAAGRTATAVGRYINSIKRWVDPQSGMSLNHNLHNVNFSWIQLPESLSNGCSYTVSLGNGLSGNLLYDEARTVSRAIHVNQVGYLDWAPEKYAYMGAWGGSLGPIEFAGVTNRQFHLVDTNGTSVFSGPVTLRYDPTLYEPSVFVNDEPATDATSYWYRVVTLPVEGVATTVRVDMVTALGVTNASVARTYTWQDGAVCEASEEDGVLPQNNYTSSTAEVEVRVYPTTEPIGEYVYEMDFSEYRGTGTFYVTVAGVGRSWPFDIGPDVYGTAFYTMMKGLYQQRSGFEVSSNRLAWARPAAHTHIYRSHCASVDDWWADAQTVNGSGSIGFFEQAAAEVWNMRHVCGAESNFASFYANPRAQPEWAEALDALYRIPDCHGGWYDAADYDSRPGHVRCLYDLATAFVIASNAMADGICNMDESGNGIPDLLDECLWGLRIYRKSQREDGGVSVRFESYSHPGGHSGTNDVHPYFASYPDRYSAVLYAGAAALVSWAVRPFDATVADDYLQSASNAYAFSQNEDNRVRNISYRVPANPYSPSMSDLFESKAPTMLEFLESPGDPDLWVDYGRAGKWGGNARMRSVREYRYDEPVDFFPPSDWDTGPYVWQAPFFLYLASGNAMYADIVNDIKAEYEHPRTDNDLNANFLVAFSDLPDIDAGIRQACRAHVLDAAEDRMSLTNRAFRHTQDNPISWGGSTLQHDSRVLLHAYSLTGETNYLVKALLVNDFMLGCRPMGLVFTTGMGWNSIVHLLHATSADDGIAAPSPGIGTYAPTGGTSYRWLWRGYRLHYTRTFSRMYSGTKTVDLHFLPPPFDAAGGEARNDVPSWRKAQVYEDNAGLWEFTIQETISPQILGFAPFVPAGWMPGDGLTNMAPRSVDELYGYYFMP